MTLYDKFLLFLWCLPILGVVAYDLFSIWPDTPRRRARMADTAAQQMDLKLSPELAAAVVRRIRHRHAISARVTVLAWLPGVIVIFFAWRHSHMDVAAVASPLPPEYVIAFAALGVAAVRTILGSWRSLRRPLIGERSDLANARTPAPRLVDVLPRWYRRLQRVGLVFPVAATVYYLTVSGGHRSFNDLGVCLVCAVLIGAVFTIDRWQDWIVRAPQRADAEPAETAADDAMRVVFVTGLAGYLYLYLTMWSNVLLAAAPVPEVDGQWVFPFSWIPIYGLFLFAPNLKSKYGQRVLLWQRRKDSARDPGYARYTPPAQPMRPLI